ncbi:hypothetical protein KM176_08330 [Pseudooceanicola sp. CBS1P-1]|uniref:LuxR family transcriptional regulator n=1 Tax=Pseudooceanicola albus TaxID=2692189 RepID=A0A6L7G033_9RHOB|nr:MULTISPECIES: LuxR family transcriptional regulator [Pseudooceanicola]MBT9383860.1 hypothetical protein [Pseudooceanicola endophyticus]MXN17714.1 LuxR family transcriptional regulator [Pseudooceanicola albus]
MVAMGNFPVISIWDGCDPKLASAVAELQRGWGPFSAAKGTANIWHLDRLLEDLIDPAVAALVASSPIISRRFILGAWDGKAFSEALAELGSYRAAAKAQHLLLKSLVTRSGEGTEPDRELIATLETLVDLLRACAWKPPERPVVQGEGLAARRLNRRRYTGYCRFCGALAEFSEISEGVMPAALSDPEEKLKFSTYYCSAHRPQLRDELKAAWRVNPAYRRAMRSLEWFDQELKRLSRQAGVRRMVLAQTGDPLTDCYYHRYVEENDLRAGDEAELRQHARRLVDARMTDRKKQILILERAHFSHAEIAERLGVERQAVSKALKTIPKGFRHLLLRG